MVSDRFKECIPADCMDFVRGKEITNWLEAHELAEMLDIFCGDRELSQSGQVNQMSRYGGRKDNRTYNHRPAPLQRKSDVRCTRCNAFGHLQSQCFSKLDQPYIQNSKGQQNGLIRNVWANSGENEGPRDKKFQCFNCGGPHLKRNCPKLTESFAAKRIVCKKVFSKDFQEKGNEVSGIETDLKHPVSRVHVKNSAENACTDIQEKSTEGGVHKWKFGDFDVGNVGNLAELGRNKSECVENVCSSRKGDFELSLLCGDSVIRGVLDSGAQISVLHADLVPEAYLDDNCSKGMVSLQGAFGKPVQCKLYALPFKLSVFSPGVRENSHIPQVMIVCAITDLLSEKKMLLSVDDYMVLKQSVDDAILPIDFLGVEQICEKDFLLDSQIFTHVFCQPVNISSDTGDTSIKSDSSQDSTRDTIDNSFDLGSLFDDKVEQLTSFKSEFSELQQNDVTLGNCFVQAAKKKGPYYADERTGILFKRVCIKGETRDQLVLPVCKRPIDNIWKWLVRIHNLPGEKM